MDIRRLELTDIKSYGQSGPIDFAEGVNAISGPTGAGKSTLLEAIGFALFDAPPCRPESNFVREGAKRGEVVVTFTSAQDERPYQVVREAGSSTYYVYDPETRSRLVSGKQDVLDWLKEHLGVDRSADLGALFNDAVGVPQGLLTAAFLENIKGRKAKFDPLLQVDEYEKAWELLSAPKKYLGDEVAARKIEEAALQGKLGRLPSLQQQEAALVKALQGDQQALNQARATLQEVDTAKAALDAALAAFQQSERALERAQAEVQRLQGQINSAEAEVQRCLVAARVTDETRQGHERYEAARLELETLQVRLRERQDLVQQRANADRDHALAQQQIGSLGETLQEIAASERRLTELAPQVAEQQRLEGQLAEARQAANELSLAEQHLRHQSEVVKGLEAELQQVEKGVAERERMEAEQEQVAGRRDDLQRELAETRAEAAQKAGQAKELAERLALLKARRLERCPVCQRPLDEAHAEELEARFCADLEGLQAQGEDLEERLTGEEAQLKEIEAEAAALAKRVGSLPTRQRPEELRDRVAAQIRVVEDARAAHDRLREAPQRLEGIEKSLAKLGNPLREHDILQARVSARPAMEEQLQSIRQALAALAQNRAALDEQLLAFADLDAAIEAQQGALESSRDDHSRHLEHRQLASALEERQEVLGELRQHIREAEERRSAADAACVEARAAYDADEHGRMQEQHLRLTEEGTRLDERLKANRRQLVAVQQEIETLQAVQRHLALVQSRLEHLLRLSEALEFLRKTVRAAGPYVTRALVRDISREADRIFGEILNDRTMRLQWGEDYGITVEHLGNERDFAQLSGGEKAAAALAVRLALLRAMTAIRVAFFDEPTAHLDDQRRDNLAAQITEIRGFQQLFVISHDDAFERQTHHVLRVHKENGVSRVEVA